MGVKRGVKSKRRPGPRGPYKSTALGRRIKRLRLAAALTQQDLASYLGLQTVTVWRLEIGRQKTARAETLRALAAVFGVSVDSLLAPERGVA